MEQTFLVVQTTPIDVGDSQRQAQIQVFTVAIGADLDIPGRSVVIVSGHLDGACVASSGLIEPQWHSGTPKHLHVVSAQCRKATSNCGAGKDNREEGQPRGGTTAGRDNRGEGQLRGRTTVVKHHIKTSGTQI